MSQLTRTTPVAAAPQQQQQQQLPPSEITTKKKLGKNLNRLTRPPSPPDTKTAKVSTASKNGLLLLSTKRSSAGGGNVATSSGGILSNKSSNTTSKPLPSLGLQCQSNTSTHDALLGAVVGASRAEAQHQPDAWGVADKKEKNSGSSLTPPPSNHNQTTPPEGNQMTQQHISPSTLKNRNNGDEEGTKATHITNTPLAPAASWDEYGGRNRDMSGQGTQGGKVLWGEKSNKQKTPSRAPDVDKNKTLKSRDGVVSSPANGSVPSKKLKPKLVLEKLNRSHGLQEDNVQQQRKPTLKPADKGNTRTLYDPNGTKSYSSLVGGSSSKDDNKKEPSAPSAELATNGGRVQSGSRSPEATSTNDSREPKNDTRQPGVIHLSSYETRDRGERNANAGPRMLFDPKSGSMVAVPSRDDPAATSNARGRKERGGKKGRRDKESKAEKADCSDNGKTGRKGKQKRDDVKASSPSKADGKKGRSTNSRKFPRTRGVLYARDNKGSLYSVDGCDGDLGYGAHCVPGGRTKNADAYSKYVEQQKQAPEDEVSGFYRAHSLEASYEKDANDQDHGQFIALQTGFNVQEPAKLDWVKPNEKISLVTGVDDSPTLQATAKEWAPSEAALAAAAAALEQEKESMSSPVHGHDDEDEDDDEDDAPLGLGFDPTLNMDSVIQSPSSEPASSFDAVNLASLSLEPSALKSTAKSNHIFAFESGATWGSSNTGDSNDWGIPTTGTAFTSDDPATSSVMPSTFLSLSTGGTWGGVPGLGGTSEHNNSNGD